MAAVSVSRPARVHFVCARCGAAAPKWAGRCAACGEWNSFSEEVLRPKVVAMAGGGRAGETTPLAAVDRSPNHRLPSGLGEVDRVLGGGLVAGTVVLLGGDPGIGKSTLALQMARTCGTSGAPALYCAGEESPAQLSLRAERIGCADGHIRVLADSDVDMVLATIAAMRPRLAVIDSVQTLHDTAVPGAPGSPSQVREAVIRVARCAKASGVPVLMVGHVTKEGAIAGPRTLEHMVDVVLYLEGDRLGDHRLLRGIKNRFGSTGELGLLSFGHSGIADLDAGGRAFVDGAAAGVPGSVIAITCDGSRPLAVEVQALCVRTSYGLPRRAVSGFDVNRLHLLLAVLEKRAGVPLSQSDVFVNVVGGVRLVDPGVDLAIALAIAGAARNRAAPQQWAVVGEVGLAGEIRRVRRLDTRLAEAAALGMEGVICAAPSDLSKTQPLPISPVKTLATAIDALVSATST